MSVPKVAAVVAIGAVVAAGATVVAVRALGGHAPPGRRASTARLVAATLPVRSCRSSYGFTPQPPARPYQTIRASVPAGDVGRLSAFSDSVRSLLPIVAPRGWGCAAEVGADGSTVVTAYPPGGSASGLATVSAYDASLCQSCIYFAMCPYVPKAVTAFAADGYGACSPTRPPRQTETWLSGSPHTRSGVLEFTDPAGAGGSGKPYPTIGLLLYRLPGRPGTPFGLDRASTITCTVPAVDRSLCTAVLDEFRQQNWPDGDRAG